MENNSNEKEERYEPQPSLNGQNMDSDRSEDSYIDDQIPGDETSKESEEKQVEWPFEHLHQQISDTPDGNKNDAEIKSGSEEENKSTDAEPTEDRITTIRPFKGDWKL